MQIPGIQPAIGFDGAGQLVFIQQLAPYLLECLLEFSKAGCG
jgi:hypothetical protein